MRIGSCHWTTLGSKLRRGVSITIANVHTAPWATWPPGSSLRPRARSTRPDEARFLNQAIIDGAKRGVGLGEAVGAGLCEEKFPHSHCSILARAFELRVPVTVHVAIGTDTIHAHPSADGASLGKTSHHDFRLFASLVSRLEEGVFINLGSAVIIPEVFLKALTLVRNLGHEVKRFTTLNMDFLRHYRPMTNVVHRPTVEGGEGYFIVGHHEIMFPLLAAAVIEGMAGV